MKFLVYKRKGGGFHTHPTQTDIQSIHDEKSECDDIDIDMVSTPEKTAKNPRIVLQVRDKLTKRDLKTTNKTNTQNRKVVFQFAAGGLEKQAPLKNFYKSKDLDHNEFMSKVEGGGGIRIELTKAYYDRKRREESEKIKNMTSSQALDNLAKLASGYEESVDKKDTEVKLGLEAETNSDLDIFQVEALDLESPKNQSDQSDEVVIDKYFDNL